MGDPTAEEEEAVYGRRKLPRRLLWMTYNVFAYLSLDYGIMH
jgi:hypothetical protein